MKPLDSTDLQILSLLQGDGRMTVKQMSSHLGLSTTPIFERIKKLERSGVIDHYTVKLNHEKLGKKLVAFAHISLKDHNKDQVKLFESKILDISDVTECHYVTGKADFIIKVRVEGMEQYKNFVLDKLFDVPNIGNVETYLSLEVKK